MIRIFLILIIMLFAVPAAAQCSNGQCSVRSTSTVQVRVHVQTPRIRKTYPVRERFYLRRGNYVSKSKI